MPGLDDKRLVLRRAEHAYRSLNGGKIQLPTQ